MEHDPRLIIFIFTPVICGLALLTKLIIEYIPYVSLKEIDAIYDLVVKSLSEEEKPEISNDLPF